MIDLLAHAGETHFTVSEATTHSLSDWYVALPLFVLALVGFGAILQLTFRKSFVTLTAVSVALLIIGFTAYNISALISVLAITLGLAGTLTLTLTSLSQPQTSKATAREKES